jgi:vesicle-fusing ATPase
MPGDNLHTTVLEITHSKTPEEIATIVQSLGDKAEVISDYPYDHRTRLIKPYIGFDASAIAVSFVPAAGEALGTGREAHDDDFTYHHLRRDVFDLCAQAGISVASRYIVPTAHLTIARFIEPGDFQSSDGTLDRAKVAQVVSTIEMLNAWLKEEYWPTKEGAIKAGGEFMVGSGKGLIFREGALWYGGGRSIYEGKGY